MGIANPGLRPLQIKAFFADAQILEDVDSCTVTVFSGVTTHHNGGIAQGR